MVKIEMVLNPTARHSKVILDDVDISGLVSNVEVHAGVNEMTSTTITYICKDEPVGITGEFDVVHVCPLSFGRVALVVDRDDPTQGSWHPINDTFIDRGGVRRLDSSIDLEDEAGE